MSSRCDALETLVRIVASVGKVKLIRISVENGGFVTNKPAALRCELFEMVTENPDFVPFFLRLLVPGCELKIRSARDCAVEKILKDPAVFDTDVIKSAPSISISWRTAVTDEQIVQLQAETISMGAPSITSRGIIQLLLEWIEGKRKITCIKLNCLRSINKEEIFRGINSANLQPLSMFPWIIFPQQERHGIAYNSAIICNVTGDVLAVFASEISCLLQAYHRRISPHPT
ncbi:hypothetical protein OESDEN_08392 [Oesophagostomum dentatum]|uniref:Uncharacterized protein n=1 Tax=Oesophagostomum dentatum TaxID=61180 RepID=A0A0B1T3C9_OESDE|nr:hypothetical protein OESDEN_08392 [Oesophagostomum dentatum]